MRPKPIIELLDSVVGQTRYPDEIIIVDGSNNAKTQMVIEEKGYDALQYYLIKEEDRGLTKQRNIGVKKASKEIICFLDDDIVLTPNYFKYLIKSYENFPNALGVGGYIIGEVEWTNTNKPNGVTSQNFIYDGFCRKLGTRNSLRKKMGLLSDQPPGRMPEFSNGLSISFLPPSGKTYEVDYFMGGVSSFKRSLFDDLNFSEYFEGYGLYEDLDFCLRASEKGHLYVNTKAQLYHNHDASGRPNKYSYGKMVIRNGWYVWRVKYPKPTLIARFKWHFIAFLLTFIKFSNIINTSNRTESLTEAFGRIAGWFSLIFNKPKITS